MRLVFTARVPSWTLVKVFSECGRHYFIFSFAADQIEEQRFVCIKERSRYGGLFAERCSQSI